MQARNGQRNGFIAFIMLGLIKSLERPEFLWFDA